MGFAYKSGEEVRSGDHVTYHGELGEVEFVVERATGDPTMDWYFEQFPGGGFMVNVKSLGRVFLSGGQIEEDLEFLARRRMR
jgi:hypothetical protein